MRTVFWLENPKGRDHSEDLRVAGRIILEWIYKNRVGSFGLYFVNTVMNLRIPYNAGNFLTSWVTVRISTILLHGIGWLVSHSVAVTNLSV